MIIPRKYPIAATAIFLGMLMAFMAIAFTLAKRGDALAARFDYANWLSQGENALLHGSKRATELRFNAMLDTHPESPDAWAGLVAAALYGGDEEEIEATVTSANIAIRDEHRAIAFAILIRTALTFDDVESASSYLATSPDNAEMTYLRSVLTYREGDANAFNDALSEISTHNESGTSLLFRTTRKFGGEYPKSLADKLVDIPAALRQAWALGDRDVLAKLLVDERLNAEAVYLRGLLAEASGNRDAARADYAYASELNANLSGARVALERLGSE